ncbi:hypothetical protein GobsT_12750 [Gemmata obscuriglobus]|uniref:Uncharacterized protein n=1 Tax=Gemmata obscuriglobus TaxID=114 RepID=A0A2Z3HBC5_9BACT|nr:hypothetical protein [Gemmata obscuriglobus]AWM40265.1 hypothetical protein C1280_26860 [Gemmata obscuriglobus]QEG26535.1 hypothetical protein GobsT_12750 [Gemmata obscuriglobus]VTS01892.1 Uncharacterized protein OS=Variovorax paradoxus (strain EPS) GN=Varpa_5560 PE=4 SV=1 [Gemmata obscuriglobus UQM 2246]
MGKHRNPAGSETRPLAGTVRQHNFSPKGEIEGVLLDTDSGPVQVNFLHGPGTSARPVPTPGAPLRLIVAPNHRAADHAPGDHPVYEFVADADTPEPAAAPVAEGVVTRLNYARHGEPNGVVLDTGDFVHLKPHGMRQVALAVGTRVAAEGTARPTVTGHRVIEATVVNGTKLAHGGRH